MIKKMLFVFLILILCFNIYGEIKCKVFYSTDIRDLEEEINNFIKYKKIISMTVTDYYQYIVAYILYE